MLRVFHACHPATPSSLVAAKWPLSSLVGWEVSQVAPQSSRPKLIWQPGPRPLTPPPGPRLLPSGCQLQGWPDLAATSQLKWPSAFQLRARWPDSLSRPLLQDHCWALARLAHSRDGLRICGQHPVSPGTSRLTAPGLGSSAPCSKVSAGSPRPSNMAQHLSPAASGGS